MFTPIKLNISPDQHEKLKDAVKHEKSVSMKVTINGKKSHRPFLLTHSQLKRLERAKSMNKLTVNSKLSKRMQNTVEDFLVLFQGQPLGSCPRFLPTLLGGLATGLISGGVEKAVSGRGVGDGLYLYKSGKGAKIIPIRGGGVQLMPNKKLHGVCGDGLFVKRGSQIYDGRGLLLGKNSPFKNIPILGLIL